MLRYMSSASGTKRTLPPRRTMSAFGGKADMTCGRISEEEMVPLPATGRGVGIGGMIAHHRQDTSRFLYPRNIRPCLAWSCVNPVATITVPSQGVAIAQSNPDQFGRCRSYRRVPLAVAAR